jgi:hypothetical protein
MPRLSVVSVPTVGYRDITSVLMMETDSLRNVEFTWLITREYFIEMYGMLTEILSNIPDHQQEPLNMGAADKSENCPTTRYRGSGGVRRYSSYSFRTLALDEGEWSASRPGRALAPRIGSPVPIGQEAGWAPETVWTQMLEEKSFASTDDRIPTDCPVVQSVVRHYTD